MSTTSTESSERWVKAHEDYLLELAAVCRRMAQAYHVIHHTYLTRQKRVRVPIIAVSSLSGMMSFGTEVFPSTWHKYVNIVVGIAGLMVALVGSIESFLRMSETISGSATTALNLEKLAESICLELSMPVCQRHSEGAAFARTSYGHFEKHMETAPNVLKKVVFLRPPWMMQQHADDTGGQRRATQDIFDLLPALPPEALQAYRRMSIGMDRASLQQLHKNTGQVGNVALPGMVESPPASPKPSDREGDAQGSIGIHAESHAVGGGGIAGLVQHWRTRAGIDSEPDVEAPMAFH